MYKRIIFIPILLFLFTILQINNNNSYINQFSNDAKNFEYKDYIKEKTLFESLNNQLINTEFKEEIDFTKKNNDTNDKAFFSVVFFSPFEKSFNLKINFHNNYFKKEINSNLNPRAPPFFNLYT